MNIQVKSKKRVKENAEVFTNDREIYAMLDLIPDEIFKDPYSTFLEPAFGHGNFLIAIFKKKMRFFTGDEPMDLYALKIISNIYAIELMQDNIDEAKTRMLKMLDEDIKTDRKDKFLKSAKFFIDKNIVQGDSLKFDTNTFNQYVWTDGKYKII